MFFIFFYCTGTSLALVLLRIIAVTDHQLVDTRNLSDMMPRHSGESKERCLMVNTANL
jgi:hypothetical protein